MQIFSQGNRSVSFVLHHRVLLVVVERERDEKMVREVAESCVDTMLMEMVAMYSGRFYANKPELAARRIEAIGYQVGHQLSERSVPLT